MTDVSISMDEDLKARTEEILRKIGMDWSVAVRLFAEAMVREKTFPLYAQEDPSDPFWSETNQAHLRRAYREVEEGKVIRKTMEELEAMAADE